MSAPTARHDAFEDLQAGLLLERIAEGDTGAFAELCDSLSIAMFNHYIRAAVDRECAEELTTSTLLQIWVHAPRFQASDKRALEWISGFLRSGV